MERVTVFADGACLRNPDGPGGWAAIIASDGGERELSGGDPKTTNNRMEIRAVIEGLRALDKPSRVTVYSDSTYVVDAFRRGWIVRWQRDGWRTKSKTPVKNLDLWEELLAVASPHAVEWKFVKGHSGVRLNERADALAQAAARRAIADAFFALSPQ